MPPDLPARPNTVTVAATQFSCTWNTEANLATAERLVRKAANAGAHIIVLPELFETPYFCQTIDDSYFRLATPIHDNPAIHMCRDLASELGVVIPVSTFERDRQHYFNSLTTIDADGHILGTYRKTHIPEGPGYHEKFYFQPGDSGFAVWSTRYATIGVGICWDQWFPETARTLALNGAELLIFPTAIGTSPQPATGHPEQHRQTSDLQDTQKRLTHWRNVQCGHAAANMIPLIAANRVGPEHQDATRIEFFGHSFIANQRGEVIDQLEHDDEEIILHPFDLDEIRIQRASWALFRDRRPSQYHQLTATGRSNRPAT